jgi:segregation and condensation protein A
MAEVGVLNLEKFEGPLDLLLELIDGQKLSITEVSLTQVTEQYLNYLSKLEDYYPEELAQFLVVASRLVYLKSKMLLPYLYPEEDEGPSLAEQLKLYKQFVEASKYINKLWQAEAVSYGRIEPPIKATGFIMPVNAEKDHLYSAFMTVLKRLKPLNPLPHMTIDRTLSVKQKIESLYQVLKAVKKLTFHELVGEAESRTEVIVSFLAILELVKQERASIQQELPFDTMSVVLV